MNTDYLQRNWALVLAIVLLMLVAIVIGSALIRRSPWGQLRHAIADFKVREKNCIAAHATTVRAQKTLASLQARARNVKPRLLQEAKENAEDSIALQKIADDQLLIAANHVRRVIHEEYPPNKQERLRNRYLPNERSDKRPFSF